VSAKEAVTRKLDESLGSCTSDKFAIAVADTIGFHEDCPLSYVYTTTGKVCVGLLTPDYKNETYLEKVLESEINERCLKIKIFKE
jgi:hypothetical protein